RIIAGNDLLHKFYFQLIHFHRRKGFLTKIANKTFYSEESSVGFGKKSLLFRGVESDHKDEMQRFDVVVILDQFKVSLTGFARC
ncbi:MAG: hypothetical protein WCE57_15665, partial [Salegentibacter sp.]